MSKVLFSTLVAALVCIAASNAKAEGISADTLGSMGLTGMTVMSDSEGMAIRGKGFAHCDDCIRTEPYTTAFGNSWATMQLENCPDCVALEGGAHSENAYIAEGPYFSQGTNFSEAGGTLTTIESVDIGGVVTTLTKTTTARVFAGGFSSARAF